MARSFGDLSHAVYYPADYTTGVPRQMLFIDYWNSPQGLMQFFSNEQVQQGGKLVFKERDYVLWANTPGLPRVSLPAPAGRNDRFVGLVRGPVASRAGAERILMEATRKALNTNRAKGLMAREWYFRLAAPGEPESLEAIGYDLWFDAEGMQAVYSDPDEMQPLQDLFTARPETSVWGKPPVGRMVGPAAGHTARPSYLAAPSSIGSSASRPRCRSMPATSGSRPRNSR
jgi:hypothetical protein